MVWKVWYNMPSQMPVDKTGGDHDLKTPGPDDICPRWRTPNRKMTWLRKESLQRRCLAYYCSIEII